MTTKEREILRIMETAPEQVQTIERELLHVQRIPENEQILLENLAEFAVLENRC